MRIALTALAATMTFASTAQAELRACNETDQLVSVAHAFVDPEDGKPFSTGWKNIPAGECQTLSLADRPKVDAIYWRATVLGKAVPEAGKDFCTSSKGFMSPLGKCENEGWELRPYARTPNKSPEPTVITFRTEDAQYGIPGGSDELSRIDDAMQGNWVDQQKLPYRFDRDGVGRFAGSGEMHGGRIAQRCLSMPKSMKGKLIGYESSRNEGGQRLQCLLIESISEDTLIVQSPTTGAYYSLTRVE